MAGTLEKKSTIELIVLPQSGNERRRTLASEVFDGGAAHRETTIELKDESGKARVTVRVSKGTNALLNAKATGSSEGQRLELRVRAQESMSIRVQGELDVGLRVDGRRGQQLTANHNGDGKGDCAVMVRHEHDARTDMAKQAVRTGNGDGNARCEGAGPGCAYRSGAGDGDAIRAEGQAPGKSGRANGDARRTGAGKGDAIVSIRGKGHALRTGPGDGGAKRLGGGDGNAIRAGCGTGGARRESTASGHSGGIARRSGDGDGDAWANTGDAVRNGTGDGNAVCESADRGDAVRNGNGAGDAQRRCTEARTSTTSRPHGNAWRLENGSGDARVGAGVDGWAVAAGEGGSAATNAEDDTKAWTGGYLREMADEDSKATAERLADAPRIVRETYAVAMYISKAIAQTNQHGERVSAGEETEDDARQALQSDGFLIEVRNDRHVRLSGTANGPGGVTVAIEATEGSRGFRTRGINNAALATGGQTRDLLRAALGGYRQRIEQVRRGGPTRRAETDENNERES